MKFVTSRRGIHQRTPLLLLVLVGGAIGYLLGSSLSSTSYSFAAQQPTGSPLENNDKLVETTKTKTSSTTRKATLTAKNSNPGTKLAYVFYVTLPEYYCGALVNAYQLIKLGKDPNIEIIVFTSAEFQPLPQHRATAESLHIKHMPVAMLPLGEMDEINGNFKLYYLHSMVKLSIFSLYQAGYTRVIFLDADSLILKSLDELFYLPSVGLAAPRAYWLDPGPLKPGCGSATWPVENGPEVGLQQKFTSALMVVEPSKKLWDRLLNKYWPDGERANFTNLFDMDLLNIEFKDEVMLLPGSLLRLSSDWAPEGRKNSRHIPGNEEELDGVVLDSTYVLHFSWGGKVWSMGTEAFSTVYPEAHPYAKKIWEMWWALGGMEGKLKCAELGPGGVAAITVP